MYRCPVFGFWRFSPCLVYHTFKSYCLVAVIILNIVMTTRLNSSLKIDPARNLKRWNQKQTRIHPKNLRKNFLSIKDLINQLLCSNFFILYVIQADFVKLAIFLKCEDFHSVVIKIYEMCNWILIEIILVHYETNLWQTNKSNIYIYWII